MGEGVLAEAQGLCVYVKWAACVCVRERERDGERELSVHRKIQVSKRVGRNAFFPPKGNFPIGSYG